MKARAGCLCANRSAGIRPVEAHMKPIPLISSFDAIHGQLGRPWHSQYFAMYSSVYGGIVTDPALMLIPVDDHMAHRGDGVFETFKCVAGAIYNLKAHLDRLEKSAASIYLRLPCPRAELEDIIIQTTRVGAHSDCLVRLFVSRGPGSLGISPYDCPAPALYVVIAALKPPFMEQHPGGARVRTSHVAVKPSPYVRIKSVNYLSNVLMKKEAADAGVDFTVNFDECGFLAEGPTENAGIVTADGVLQVPRLERILAGTTMLRVLALAQGAAVNGRALSVEQTDITLGDVAHAAELLIFGTTPDVTAAVEFDGRAIGDGKPGPAYRELSRRLTDDIRHNPGVRTPVF